MEKEKQMKYFLRKSAYGLASVSVCLYHRKRKRISG
ncbi:YSIRK-type signal peptide-containing protein [Streptococcus iniae]